MAELTLLDLIRNGTMDAHVAATLWSVVEEQRSFMVVAVPRFAGKSAVTDAIFQFAPPEVPVYRLSGHEQEMERLRLSATGGYLVVGEFSQAPVPTYIWGQPVRKVFETLRAGYSLATALHAPSVEEAYAVVCQGNGIADENASRISYMLYIRRMGDDRESFWRRIAEVHEVDRVVDGRPQARLLHRWVEEGDRFERVQAPRLLAIEPEALGERVRRLQALVDAGRTALADVQSLVQG